MHRRFVILAAAVLSLIALTAGVAAQEALSSGTPVEGTFEGQPVSYSIDASAGQLMIISMTSDEIDSLVRVEQNGTELASDDDSGDYPNALLAFVVPEDGSYDILADQGYGDDTGAYTLQVDVVTPTVLENSGSTVLEPASGGSLKVYALLDGVEGAVVDISATSQGDEDVRLRLAGVDGQEIETDDDDGPDDSALLRRVVLPATGMNLIEVSLAYGDDPVTAPVDLNVEATDALYLSAEPQAMTLGDGEGQVGTEVFTVDMTAGTTYRFIVTIPPMPDDEGGVKLELFDSDRFFTPDVEAQHATRVAWDYTATGTGTVRLVVHPNFFSDDLYSIDYTIAMETVE